MNVVKKKKKKKLKGNVNFIHLSIYVPSLIVPCLWTNEMEKIFNGEGQQIYAKTVKLEYSIGN